MAMYKEQYGKALENLVPASAVLQDLIPFPEDDRLGDSYRQSVIATSEHGFSYGGSSGAVVSLASPIQAVIAEANHSGFEIIGRSRISYAAASRGTSSKKAFAQTWGTVLKNLKLAGSKRLEHNLLYGQLGLGVVSGALSTETATITDASWCPAIWAGLEGCSVEVFTTTSATATEHGEADECLISTISLSAKTVTSATSDFSGDTPVDDADVISFRGARTATAFNEAAGLMKIAQNSGSLFGIDAATYALWAGNTKTSFGVPTMGRFLDALTEAIDRGLDEKAYLLVCPKTWEVLNADLAGKRSFDGSYSKAKAENGAQAISYFGQVGELEVRVHPFMRRGDAVIMPISNLKRVGSADLGMGVPGLPGEASDRQIFFHVEADGAVEARVYSDQALFCDAPSKLVHISGITY
jgi:hypothetical protein